MAWGWNCIEKQEIREGKGILYSSLKIKVANNPYAHKGLGAVFMDLGLFDYANYHFELAGTDSVEFVFKEQQKYGGMEFGDAIKCLE